MRVCQFSYDVTFQEANIPEWLVVVQRKTVALRGIVIEGFHVSKWFLFRTTGKIKGSCAKK